MFASGKELCKGTLNETSQISRLMFRFIDIPKISGKCGMKNELDFIKTAFITNFIGVALFKVLRKKARVSRKKVSVFAENASVSMEKTHFSTEKA